MQNPLGKLKVEKSTTKLLKDYNSSAVRGGRRIQAYAV